MNTLLTVYAILTLTTADPQQKKDPQPVPAQHIEMFAMAGESTKSISDKKNKK